MPMRDLNEFSNLFWGPWSEFRALAGELDHLLQGTEYERQGQPLPVNLWDGEDGAVLTAEMAGLKPDSIHVRLDGRQLTIECEKPWAHDNGHRVVRRETLGGTFARSVHLGFDPDPDGVEARYHNGQLQVRLPKAVSAKPRKIEVRAQS